MTATVFSFKKSLMLAACASLSACATMPAVGPSSGDVAGTNGVIGDSRIRVVDVNNDIVRHLQAAVIAPRFSDSLGDGPLVGTIVGKGDVLDISVWEAPPATLFGTMSADPRMGAGVTTSTRATTLPEQMVDSEGYIQVPFVGRVLASDRSTQQIAKEIDRRLAGKAHQPQTIVRMARNSTRTVTIVGDVATSTRIPLTAQGERVLDALAAAGGVKQPVGKMTMQITRGDRVVAMPLEQILKEPRENIRLQSDDVVTALFQPYSFTALGATGRNDEIPFEGTGITLAQALGRVSGLQDSRANVKGVFIFRMEDTAVLPMELRPQHNGVVPAQTPVIYRINMKDPAMLFWAQSFGIRNRDVLYVSNAPLADIQKFVNVISSTILPVATVTTIVQ